MRAFWVCANVEMADELRAVPALWGEHVMHRRLPWYLQSPTPIALCGTPTRPKDSTFNLEDLQQSLCEETL
jgi:hypothetical protein